MFRKICMIMTLGVIWSSAHAMPLSYKNCAACHGTDGNTTITQYPKLAGQSPNYFIKQMMNFQAGAQGDRPSPIMEPFAIKLSKNEIEQMAKFYHSQSTTISGAQPTQIKLGELIYRGGIKEKNIPACSACHGPNGSGNSLANYPRLSGQNAEYVEIQLINFSQDKRRNDPNAMMRDIAKRLSPAEIKAVANYISGLY